MYDELVLVITVAALAIIAVVALVLAERRLGKDR